MEKISVAQTIKPYLKQIDTFIDVGAYHGFYSILVGKENPNVEIFTFEPNKKLYKITKRNFKKNEIKANLFNKGVWSQTGKKELYWKDSESSFNTNLYDSLPRKKRKVNVVKLDDFDFKGKIGLKIDVEGGELDVLLGAEKLFKKNIVFILIEISPSWLGQPNLTKQRVFNLLSEYKKKQITYRDYLYTRKLI